MKSRPKTIATHNGKFHPDDVLAVTILKLLYPTTKVIRTRDPAMLEKADMRIDVGGKYDFKTSTFDHHHPEGAGTRENGIPYASAGLIWKHFGKQLVTNDTVWERIDAEIIQYVDADDCGVQVYTPGTLDPYKIRDIILNYNPTWKNENNELYDTRFLEMVGMFEKILRAEIERAEASVLGERLVREEIKKLPSNAKYLILEKHIPWKRAVIEETKLLFVVAHNPLEKNWAVIGVPKTSENPFDYRKYLPREWGGLTGIALQKATGVSDAIFCHRNCFIIVSASKASALALVEKALAE